MKFTYKFLKLLNEYIILIDIVGAPPTNKVYG